MLILNAENDAELEIPNEKFIERILNYGGPIGERCEVIVGITGETRMVSCFQVLVYSSWHYIVSCCIVLRLRIMYNLVASPVTRRRL